MNRIILFVLAAACLLFPANALADNSTARIHKHPITAEQYIHQLEQQNRQLRRVAAVRLRAVRTLRIQNGDLRLVAYAAQVQRDQALAGLPETIKAVPIKDFHRLVFAPAFSVFPCDTYSTSNTLWTFSFSSSC